MHAEYMSSFSMHREILSNRESLQAMKLFADIQQMSSSN